MCKAANGSKQMSVVMASKCFTKMFHRHFVYRSQSAKFAQCEIRFVCYCVLNTESAWRLTRPSGESFLTRSTVGRATESFFITEYYE